VLIVGKRALVCSVSKTKGGQMTEEILLGRDEQLTKEIPLGRAEGSPKETPLGGEETPLGQGFVPGDVARIEVGFFRHEMNLEEVLAFFEHEGEAAMDDERHVIALRGQPAETEPPSGGVKYSRVSLCAIVPADAPSGVYRFRQLEAQTYGGRRVPFDESTQNRWGRWRFLVREEPDAPPTI
jgi:hypothetical protein